MLVRLTEKVSRKTGTGGKNESRADLAFPINVGLLHSYFIRPIIIIIVTFIIKLKCKLITT